MLTYKRKVNAKPDLMNKTVAVRELHITGFYQASPVDVFLCSKHKAPHAPGESIRVTSDIYMLFNQQRLDRLTREALLAQFSDMAVREPSFSVLKSRLTDDQLISLVKSRYIQAPSELLRWSRYLNTLADDQLQEYVKAQQVAQAPPVGDPASASGSSDGSSAGSIPLASNS